LGLGFIEKNSLVLSGVIAVEIIDRNPESKTSIQYMSEKKGALASAPKQAFPSAGHT
jgi:hypothetical protein